jgi:L-ascorbate metabolism protein UlaG (beta-lactamase superfamily)
MADGVPPAHRAGSSAEDRIAFIGHATVLIELDGVRLLTDPLLRDRLAHLRRRVPPVDRELIAAPDAVLISHLHRDHLDLASLRLLGPATPLLAPAGAGAWLRRRGFAAVRELSPGASAAVGALSIVAVRAQHQDRRHPGGVRAQPLGYLVRGSRTVYFAGDTERFAGMSDLLRAAPSEPLLSAPSELVHAPSQPSGAPSESSRASADEALVRSSPRIDVALVPVSGWGPRLGPGHMDPLDAARAVALLAPRMAIPIHWGTLSPLGGARRHRALLHDPPRLFARHVARLAPAVEVRILEPGRQTVLARGPTDPSRP